ncbi:hypothetical protein U1Q18_038674 [Sarracenia purpurea var. burkii]
MGINPNNHRLNQTLPRQQNGHRRPTVVTSSSSGSTTAEPPKTCADNDPVVLLSSDAAASCLEDDASGPGSHGLSLDLTIALPSPPPAIGEKGRQDNEPELTVEIGSDQFSTLLLFR